MSKRVLIVDDATFMRTLLKDILTKADYTVVGEAKDGSEAVSLYSELQPDLVTMDITMPNMTGIEALRSIMDESPEAKVIMCSAMGQQAMVLEAIKFGAKDFIVKPFEEARVVQAVTQAMG